MAIVKYLRVTTLFKQRCIFFIQSKQTRWNLSAIALFFITDLINIVQSANLILLNASPSLIHHPWIHQPAEIYLKHIRIRGWSELNPSFCRRCCSESRNASTVKGFVVSTSTEYSRCHTSSIVSTSTLESCSLRNDTMSRHSFSKRDASSPQFTSIYISPEEN